MVVLLSCLLSACATVAGPKPAFDLDKDISELSVQFGSATSISDYYKQGETTERRDAFVVGRLTLYNLQYIKYIDRFTLDRATVDSAFDITKLGVDLSITLVGRPYTKTLLGAVSSALTGSRLSLEKNFLDDKTTSALVAQMNANRKVALVPILAGLQQSVSNYPLSTAVVDLENYYEAGTPQGALQTVQVEAAKQEAAANSKIEQYRTVAFAQDANSTAIRKWLFPTATSKTPGGEMLGADGKPAPPDPDRTKQLRSWLDGNGWNGLPVERLLDASDLASARQAAVSKLGIP